MNFNGSKILQLRLEKQLSARKLSILMGNACTGQSINYWETGKTQPGAVYLGKLAEALGVDVGYFYDK